MKVIINVFRLRSGTWCASLGLGTCGWHPFPWQLQSSKIKTRAVSNFLSVHAEKLKGYEVSFNYEN